jgi:hypothetical protein
VNESEVFVVVRCKSRGGGGEIFFFGKVDFSWKIEFLSRAEVELSFKENWKGLRLNGSLSRQHGGGPELEESVAAICTFHFLWFTEESRKRFLSETGRRERIWKS